MGLENIQVAVMEPNLFSLKEIYGVTAKHLYDYLWVNRLSGKKDKDNRGLQSSVAEGQSAIVIIVL